jgi:hypothetical protein
VARADPESVALNPGWRKAVAHVYVGEGWNPGDSGDIVRQARQRIARDVTLLDPISPDSATYMNEVRTGAMPSHKRVYILMFHTNYRHHYMNPTSKNHFSEPIMVDCGISNGSTTPSPCSWLLKALDLKTGTGA